MKKNYFTQFLSIILTVGLFCCLESYGQAEFGTWSETELSTNLEIPPTHRHENAFVEVAGKFYLMGGRAPKPVEIYDPSTGTWSTGAANYNSIHASQLHHFQAVAVGTKIYAICAFEDGSETNAQYVYIYDTENDTWSNGSEIPVARRRGSAGAAVYNGKIYVIAGITNGHDDGNVAWFDEFDPVSGNWTSLTDAPRARDHFHATVIGNKLYVAGGRISRGADGPGQVFLNTKTEVDVYDFETGNWSTLETSGTFTGRAGTATVAVGNEVIVLGGEGPNQQSANDGAPWAHNEVEAINVGTGSWRALPAMNTGRHGTQALVYNNHIYIVAGSSRRGGGGATEQEAHSMEMIAYTLTEDPVDPDDDDDDDGEAGITSVNRANTEGSGLNIYPNPTSDILFFEYQNNRGFTVEIFSSNGHLEDRQTISGNSGTVNLSKLHSGIYWIKINPQDGSLYEMYKVVKQ
ncbi:MAG: kelch repeat-containing protein [Cytophagaceae bacterium]